MKPKKEQVRLEGKNIHCPSVTFALFEAEGCVDVLDVVEGAAPDDGLVEVVGHGLEQLCNVDVQHHVHLGNCIDNDLEDMVNDSILFAVFIVLSFITDHLLYLYLSHCLQLYDLSLSAYCMFIYLYLYICLSIYPSIF